MSKLLPSYIENCKIVPETNISYLEGRTMTLIEAIGLKDTQEKSLKDLLRNEIWKVWMDSYWINKDIAENALISQQKIDEEEDKKVEYMKNKLAE